MKKFLIAFVLGFALIRVQAAQTETDVKTDLQNKSFEHPSLADGSQAAEPDNWFYFSSVDTPQPNLSSTKKKLGSQSLCLKAPGATNAYRGFAQRFIAQPGKKYLFSVHVMNDSVDPIVGNSYGQISLEFKNAAGTELQRYHGPVWSASLPSDKWEEFTVEGISPDQAAMGIAVITFYSIDSNGFGTFFVDDVDLKNQPAL
jgi:hypothetical protein